MWEKGNESFERGKDQNKEERKIEKFVVINIFDVIYLAKKGIIKFPKPKSILKGRKVKFCELFSIQPEERAPIDIYPPSLHFISSEKFIH